MGTPPKKVRPTPPPSGPALVRSPARVLPGVMLVALSGAACSKTMPETQPPVLPPDDTMTEPMAVPAPEEEAPEKEVAPEEEAPADESAPDQPIPPMPNPG